jgi:predicted nucleic acid-binding protein
LTLVLLDTNAYLRLAKRVRPAVGVVFGQKGYVLTIHKSVEDEVHRSARLKSLYPWFDGQEFANERLSKQIRLTTNEKASVQAAQSVLYGWVLFNTGRYTSDGRSPPGPTDCWLLALAQVKSAIVVTDDLGMHALADDFGIAIWHGYELLDKLRSAKVVERLLIREIFEALETNGDLPKTWLEAKHSVFVKIFGPKSK